MSSSVKSDPPPKSPTPGQMSGVVLLVEDHEAVRTVTRRLLETRGLTVITTQDPDGALRASADYPGRVDVLLIDITLPGMDGRELAALLTADRPGARVVLMSGCHRDEILGGAASPVEFLSKPFTAVQLAAVIAAALDGPPPDDTDFL